MKVEISDDLALKCGITERDLKMEIAVALFKENKFTLSQAIDFSGLSRWEFQSTLAARELPMHYDVDELEKDLITFKNLNAK